MQCVKCKATWGTENLINCPYCQALIPQNYDEDILIYAPPEKNKSNHEFLTDFEENIENSLELLKNNIIYIVENYTKEIYNDAYRLNALISDLFVADDISSALKKVVEIGVASRIYLLKESVDENFEKHYFDVIKSICNTTDIDKDVIILVVNLLFWGIGMDCYAIGDNYVEPEDIANDVLNSVLNKKSEERDFADSIIDFINNTN